MLPFVGASSSSKHSAEIKNEILTMRFDVPLLLSVLQYFVYLLAAFKNLRKLIVNRTNFIWFKKIQPEVNSLNFVELFSHLHIFKTKLSHSCNCCHLTLNSVRFHVIMIQNVSRITRCDELHKCSNFFYYFALNCDFFHSQLKFQEVHNTS